MPKLTIKKPGPAGLARLRSVYHNKIVFTHGFIGIALRTANIYHNRGLQYILTSTRFITVIKS